MNWIDLVIFIIIAFYALRGYSQGIISIIVELAGYVVSYLLALKYSYLGAGIVAHYAQNSIPKAYQDTIGIALTWTISMFLYYLIAPFIIRLIPPFISHSLPNKIIGVAGSAIKGIVLVSIVLFVLYIFPLPANLHADMIHSFLGGKIINATQTLEEKFGGELSTSLTSTLQQISLIPNSLQNNSNPTEKLLYLGYTLTTTTIDQQDEITMFNFVNMQRVQNHLPKLTMNSTLQQVARDYGKYMFANGFFSHITPSGQSPFDRVKQTNIFFTYMGENIAKAPDVDAADTGFMNSPEHKANILDSHYSQIGVGVIDGGIHGKMFVQDFIGTN